MSNIIYQLNEIKKRFSDEVFLSNKGLSNEVGIHVFCYEPKDEMLVRSYFVSWSVICIRFSCGYARKSGS